LRLILVSNRVAIPTESGAHRAGGLEVVLAPTLKRYEGVWFGWSGKTAAENILAEFDGRPRKSFEYKDKGIMAMIGRGAAIAEVGKNHHEVHGQLAHMAWLGVHASLMTGARDKMEAIIDWGWDRFSKTGGPHVLDRGDAAEINWDDDAVVTAAASGGASDSEGSPDSPS